MESFGLYSGSTLKIRPVKRDLYIHHLQSLAAEENVKAEEKDSKDKKYFPPAAVAATLALKKAESITHQRESLASKKLNRSGNKVP